MKGSKNVFNFLFVCFQVDLKGETMNMAKISESGKKQRKNWSSVWTMLTTDQLMFYKDKQETGIVRKYLIPAV